MSSFQYFRYLKFPDKKIDQNEQLAIVENHMKDCNVSQREMHSLWSVGYYRACVRRPVRSAENGGLWAVKSTMIRFVMHKIFLLHRKSTALTIEVFHALQLSRAPAFCTFNQRTFEIACD